MQQGLTKQVNLQEVAVFLQLSLSRMGDKRGVNSEEIEVDADKDLVQVRKKIFKSTTFDAIKSHDSSIRRYVRSQCFPYDEGLHLCSLKMVNYIDHQLRIMLQKRISLVDNFVDVFPFLHEQIKDHLRALHKESDYEIHNIADRFTMGWQFLMLSTPTSLSSINGQILKDQQRNMQLKWDEALEDARMLLRETCLNLVTHLRDSLTNDAYGAPKRLSTSTVTSLREFFNNFNMRDITDDTQLAVLVNRGKNLLTGVDAESLRTMDELRARVRFELRDIEQAVTETLISTPTRRIKVRE
jgi:hypothetical protein